MGSVFFYGEAGLEKPELRKKFLAERLALSEEQWQLQSRALSQRLSVWLKAQDYSSFVLYRSFRREPDLDHLADELGRERCFYPRVQGQSMLMLPTASAEAFELSRWGLQEPKDIGQSPLEPDSKTLIVLPAVAIDEAGYRLGYGAGFFDRYLQSCPAATLGVCFDAFLVPALPREPHDIPLDLIATDHRLLAVRAKSLNNFRR